MLSQQLLGGQLQPLICSQGREPVMTLHETRDAELLACCEAWTLAATPELLRRPTNIGYLFSTEQRAPHDEPKSIKMLQLCCRQRHRAARAAQC